MLRLMWWTATTLRHLSAIKWFLGEGEKPLCFFASRRRTQMARCDVSLHCTASDAIEQQRTSGGPGAELPGR